MGIPSGGQTEDRVVWIVHCGQTIVPRRKHSSTREAPSLVCDISVARSHAGLS